MKRVIRRAALLLLAATAPAAPVRAEVVALVGGTVVVGDGTVMPGGTILVEGERILAVGKDLDLPAGARRLDATGKVVWPGLIDPFTTLGLVEVAADPASNDADEDTAASTAELRASDGFDPDAAAVAVTRIAGVTTVLVSPGSRNPVNGQAVVVDLAGRITDRMLVKDAAALVLNLSARRESGYPKTRPGAVAFIRQAFHDAQAYAEKRRRAQAPRPDRGRQGRGEERPPDIDLGKEALARALSGELPVIAVAPQARDVLAALGLLREFRLRMILASVREAWKVLEPLGEAKVPVLLGDTFADPGEREAHDRCYRLAAELHRAGIPFAFTTVSSHNVRQLPEHASMAVTYGLPAEAAVRALTLEPARILGIDGDHGSLAAGKLANVVVWSGDPLQITSRVERVFIRGQEVELRSRQEALRDRWQDLAAVR